MLGNHVQAISTNCWITQAAHASSRPAPCPPHLGIICSCDQVGSIRAVGRGSHIIVMALLLQHVCLTARNLGD